MDRLPAALIVFFAFAVVSLTVTKVLAHKTAQGWIDEHHQSIVDYSQEDILVDNPPVAVLVFGGLMWGTGAYIAMSLLNGHLLGF